MPGSGAEDGDYVHRSRGLRGLVYSHRFGELRPRRAIHKGGGMPWGEIAGASGGGTSSGFDSSLGSEMLDYCVVPILTTLMAKDDVVSRHGGVGSWFFEEIALLCALSEGGFREVDMVDIGTCGSLSWRIPHGADRKHK